jgi:tetratricopeptide (TPR) repeat protein
LASLSLSIPTLAQAGPQASSSEKIQGSAAPTAPPLDPAKREQLRALVRQAGEKMESGDKAGAIALLEQARSLRADPSIDYNLGVAYAELGRHPQAAEAFERFLPAADPTRFLPERLSDVRKRLADYERTLARVRTRFSVPGGSAPTLYLDERVFASLPDGKLADPRWLSPGSYRVRVAGPGLRDYSVSIDLRAGESRELTGEVLREGSESTFLGDPRPAKQEPLPFYRKPWFWAVVGGGAALGIGFIAAGAGGAFDYTAAGSDLEPVDLFRK